MSELLREIEKVKKEIAALEGSLMKQRAYLAGLEKARNLQSKQASTPETMRQGSDTRKALEVLKATGEAMHVDKLLAAMGKEITQQNKTSLTGSLAAYVRRGQIFTRPAPNTFGLLEFEANQSEQEANIFS